MVSFQDIEYYGLKIKLRPVENGAAGYHYPHRHLFLTGNITMLELTITNMTDKRRDGKIALLFCYLAHADRNPKGVQAFEVNLQPHESSNLIIRVDNMCEGQLACQVANIGTPEDVEKLSDGELVKRAEGSDGKIALTYKILDEVTWEEETRRFDELRQEIKHLEEKMTTQIDQTIKTRLTELGLTKLEVGKTIIEQTSNENPTPKKADKKPEFLW